MILKPIPGFQTKIEKKAEVVIGIYGPQGSGKTRFSATAPGPIGVVPLDRKSRFTIAKTMEEWGRHDVYMPEKDFIRHEEPLKIASMSPDNAKRYYGDHVHKVMEAAYRLAASPDIATIVIDTFSQFWENVLFKHYGRTNQIQPFLKGPANQDAIDLVTALSSKNVILIHKATELWAGSGENAKPTGRFKPAGFPHIGYHCTVMLEMRKNNLYDSSNGTGGGKPWKWSLSVTDCQARPVLEGPQGVDALTDDAITFDSLMALLYPE
jgi:hypothetical protein